MSVSESCAGQLGSIGVRCPCQWLSGSAQSVAASRVARRDAGVKEELELRSDTAQNLTEAVGLIAVVAVGAF